MSTISTEAQKVLNTVSLKDIPNILHLLQESEQAKLLEDLKLLENMKNKELAQTRFMAFVRQMWPAFISGGHHEIMAEAFERVASGECKRLIVNMPPRHDLEINEEVPTVGGWKKIKDIKPGDYVFSPDGCPVVVTGKSSVNRKPTYMVTTSDGASLRVSNDHLWTVRFECETNALYKTLSTEALYERQKKHPNTSKNPKLPRLSALRHPYSQLPIDPYVLGVWLGDGSALSGSIGCSYSDMAAMRGQVENCGYLTTHNPKFQQFNILDLIPKLRALNLLSNKHIPEEYLCASIEQRMSLLQGLIDTDGDVTKEGKVTFNQTDLKITRQVLCLVHSLGVKARITHRQTSYKGKPSQPSHRIMFKLAGAARIPRKAGRCKSVAGNWARTLTVRPTGLVEKTQCLQVANADGLFVAGRGHLVTHNTKSEFASWLLPAWFLGKFPHKKVIQTSNTAELAVGFGRKVRNLVDSQVYRDVFPGVSLQSDSKAAGRWNTNKGGDYFAIGVEGTVTGKGADILIIDDPHSEQDATMAETNPEIYDKVYSWYTSGPRQRLQPGASVIIVMCMTGDTRVLRADGSETYLRDIKPGDEVATYDDNTLTTSRVLNHQSSGIDSVFTLHTQSGRILRANRKHPFLVDAKGERKWIRLEELKLGMCLVAKKDATGPLDHKRSPDHARHATLKSHTTKSTPTRLMSLWDTTVNCGAKPASTAQSQLRSKTYAHPTTINYAGHLGFEGLYTPRSIEGINGLSPVMGLLKRISTGFFWLKTGFARCVNSLLQNIIPALIGTVSSVSTTATTQGLSGGYSATPATSQWGMQKPQQQPMLSHDTSDFTLDPIVSITPSGEEEVFDVEVERTGNFIANGVVSHNTRWAKRDLTGQVIKAAAQRGGEEWEVIEFPAIFDDERPLWPEFWSLDELLALKDELPVAKWQAQYMQQPTSEVSAIVKREWWKLWDEDRPPKCTFKIQSWDTAFLKTERSDYSACTTWGVFYLEDDTGKEQANIILLNAFKARMEFPELKQVAFKHYKEWNPDALIVEAKATGAPLVFELRAMGIPVQEFVPSRGNDKIARLNAVADIFASGRVWVPGNRWAEELVEEVASFPSGEHDDLVDSMTQALLRFRRGGFIPLQSDEPEPRREFRRRVQGYY